jgi:hypothetical protein
MPPAPASDPAAVAMLEALSAELEAAALRARLVTEPGHAAFLLVTNPAASQLSERIFAGRREGVMWFWWSWAEPIAPDVRGTAARIGRVLAAVPSGQGGP